jgi:predicted phage-related endonuclease
MIQGLQHKRSIHRRIKHMCRTMNELEKVVADYRGLKAMKEQLDEELKAVEREIIGYLDSNEKLSETGNDFTVKISTCERRTVDTKRLEADLGNLAEYQRVSQYRRLYVK